MGLLTPLPRDITLTPVRTLVRDPTASVTELSTTATVTSAVSATTVAGATICAGETTLNAIDLLEGIPKKRSVSVHALNTFFAPPDLCLTDLYDISRSIMLTAAPTEIPQCYPNGVYMVFSPGLCPSGYKIGLLSTQVVTGAECQNATTTNCICCPSMFTFTSNTCLLEINDATTNTSAAVPVAYTPSSTFIATIVDINATSNAGSYTTTESLSGVVTAVAPVFYVQYQSTDSEVSSTWSSIFDELSKAKESAASASAASAVSAISSTSANTASDNAASSAAPLPTNSSGDGLSGGAIAGIVIGAIATLVIIMGLILFALRRRRNRLQQNPDQREGSDSWQKQELDGKQVGHSEMDGHTNEVKEIYAPDAPPVELPDHSVGPGEMRTSPVTPHPVVNSSPSTEAE